MKTIVSTLFLTLPLILVPVASAQHQSFTVNLLELIRLEGDFKDKHIERVHGTPVYRRRGACCQSPI